MRLADAVFVVTDTETTGTDASRNRIIEVAAVKIQGGEIVDRFASLINPGCAVPYRIKKLTGISTSMLVDQPGPDDVLPRFLDFLGDGVFVAHNLGFDQRFLHAELDRLGLPPFTNPGLCTLRLSRRLLRGLRSKSLASVADFYGIPAKARHRAYGDAEVTAEVLRRLLSQLTFEQATETLEALLAFQHRKYAQTPRHVQRIREETLPEVPERPGVYFMKDTRGGVIYIGKAKRLRSRLKSYFYGIESHSPHIRKLVAAVRSVEWTETGTELGALLRESKLIKTFTPRFNRASRRYRNRPFIRLDTNHVIPRVSWQSYLTDDGAEYFGPLGGRRQATRVLEMIERYFALRPCLDDVFAMRRRCVYAEMGRCAAPCVDETAAAAYAAEVQRVRDFLTGNDRTILDALDAEMRAASADLDYESAARRRDEMETLRHLLDKQQCIASPVLEHNAVLLLPVEERDEVELFFVRFGRLVESMTLARVPAADAQAGLAERLGMHFDPAQPRPERYFKLEVDEIRLLAHWMYVQRERTRQLPWDPALSPEDFAAQVVTAMGEAVFVEGAWEDESLALAEDEDEGEGDQGD